MFFLLRTAFWLTIVLALIPLASPQVDDTPEGPGVDPIAALVAAQHTVSDIGGFCSRNPQACETGGQALTALGSRAATGAGIVFDYLDRTFFDGEQRSSHLASADGAPATLPAPEIAGSSVLSDAPVDGAVTGLVTGSLKLPPNDAARPAGTLTRQDLALPWDGSRSGSVEVTRTEALDPVAFGAPIGPLPKPNPRNG